MYMFVCLSICLSYYPFVYLQFAAMKVPPGGRAGDTITCRPFQFDVKIPGGVEPGDTFYVLPDG
eukprot:SAG11_NODE_29323_length_312_cov_0.713615_2_plen_63_part_01